MVGREPRQHPRLMADPGAHRIGPTSPAHHYTEAGLAEIATPYWISAGQLTINRTASEKPVNGISLWQSIDGQLQNPFTRGAVARALDRWGRQDEALAEIDTAIGEAETTGEKMRWAELVRIKGELLVNRSNDENGEAAAGFKKAIEIAQAQKAKGWELRAAIFLAKAWGRRNKTKAAHDLPAPVYGWFTEGFDTAELKDAKALLAELE